MSELIKPDNIHEFDNECPSTELASKTICVLQLTRIGDLIQTIQATRIIKEQHPDLRIILVARKKFAKGLEFLINDTFDKTILLDLKQILTENKPKNPSLANAQNNLRDFVNKINDENISVLVNLSFSKSSGYLCSLIKSDHKLGIQYDNAMNLIIEDKWSQYIYSNVMGGPLNSFSLVDIYKNIIGGNIPSVEYAKEKDPHKKITSLVIHPFASLDKKKWKTHKWVEIIYKTLKNNPDIKITIVGGHEDAEKAFKIMSDPLLMKQKNRLLNSVGKLSIKELYDNFTPDTLFIGHDSMVGHLASIAKVQTLTVSLGTVRPAETTPYGAGNYALAPKTKCYPCFPNDKCEFFQCHADIPYQAAISIIQQLIVSGKVERKITEKEVSGFHLDSVNIFRTEFSNQGLLKLKDCGASTPAPQDLLRIVYRINWLYQLLEAEEEISIPSLSKSSRETLLNCLKGLQNLYDISEFGKKYSKYILEEISSNTPDLVKIKEYSAKIDEIDGLKNVIKNSFPHLAPIIDFFTIVKGNLPGNNIVQLTENSYLAFSNCCSMSQIVFELLDNIISDNNKKRNQGRTKNISTL